MEKTCVSCSTSFEITQDDLDFYDKVSPTFGGKTYLIPPPSHCPQCRLQRRIAWRNERKLYKRKCDATGETIISNIAPDAPFKVYEKSYWFSDKWNALDYGREFDFSKTFAENFAELQREVPRFSIQQQEPMENAEYCNFASNCKDSYFLFDSDFCRDSYYSNVLKKSENCCDCSFTSDSELCYEVINCKQCYNVQFSRDCHNCSDSVFLESCIGCKNCAFCTNLRNKEYCFQNEQLSKEEYEKKLEAIDLSDYRTLLRLTGEFGEFVAAQPHRSQQGAQNEDVFGDHIYNSKNVFNGFNIEDAWDIAYCDNLYRAKNCMDVSSFGENIEWIYDCTTAGLNTQHCAFCFTSVLSSHDLYYCDTAYSSADCFGCVCIHRAQFCILNKQYTKEEYEKLVPKIIEHMQSTSEWGEFFPVTLSPFAYNETVAQDYFPLSEKDAMEKGFKWREEKDEIPKVKKIIPAEKLPDSIDDIPDDILNWAIKCEATERPYRIIKQELDFYRRMKIPIPHLHPDERHKRRMARQNPRKLWDRKCDKCQKGVQTTYSPERPEIVYCEECYLKEVY